MLESAELVLELNNELSEISRLSETVDEFCAQHRMSGQLAFNLNLVLEEVVTNVIHYAYTDAAPHRIHVNLTLSDDQVLGEVRDNGRAFDPLALAPPKLDLDLEHREVGGLGVHFLKMLMDEVVYTRNNGENCLRFIKKVAIKSESR